MELDQHLQQHQQPRSQLDEWLRSIAKFDDKTAPEDVKYKCLQDVMEHIDPILSHPNYTSFLESSIPAFIKYLQEADPEFIQETTRHQCRKLIIEIIHRLPSNEPLRPYVRNIVSAMFKTVEVDNEENVVNCLRVIIELHKQFRPPLTTETQQFLNFIKTVFKDIQGKLDKIFEHKTVVKVKEISEQAIRPLLEEIFAVTPLQIAGEKTKNLIPKASNSLKVLQELPIIVVLMYQIYKQHVQTEVAEFIPVIITTISLHPSDAQRESPQFNKEILVEFMSAQVKTLSFLAYIVKLYQDVVLQHSNLLVIGFINLLKFCPPEVSCLRRELYIAARHILNTELRYKFVPYMEKMLDDDLIVGKGWTVNETMRPMAYSTLADLTHHVRQHLCLADLIRAVLFFSCQVHDESITLGIQTMSTKLIFNLVDSIRHKSETDGAVAGRDVLLRMLEVLVYKFKTVSLVHLPHYYDKYQKEVAAGIAAKRLSAEAMESTTSSTSSAEDLLLGGRSSLTGSDGSFNLATSGKDDIKRFGSPISAIQSFTLSESRTLVKTLVCAVKTITWGIQNSKTPGIETPSPTKPFTPREVEIYIDLMKWGLKALEIYAVTTPQVLPNGNVTLVPQRAINPHGVRSKEEKEVLDHFGSVFQHLNPYTFRELFTVCIETFVERTGENPAVQLLANNLLANVNTSPIFATILVEFLLDRMEVMGEDTDRSALYLKLFKLVFGSVSLFPAENEQMLRPYLRDIVNKAMEYARSAKDPFNYFLLLRALFRSIGGGSHDLLYQEFLPLLPNLLQGLNSLQSGLHRQQMKDLFVELCLTVPVRLSSLLPYLPQLMDPLVSALNGSAPLVSQGLRTLELCVDNLQPEFLYEHIQPVRADLMQALWKIMRTPAEGSPMVAFRILGKFGGSNRKMLVEPQKLNYQDKSAVGPCVQLQFMDHRLSVAMPIEKIVELSVKVLRAANCYVHGPPTIDFFYKKQAWEFIKGVVLGSLGKEEDRFISNKLLLHSKMSDGNHISPNMTAQGADEKCRDVLVSCITGWIIATTIKDLRKDVYINLTQVLRHLAMVMTVQQVGPLAEKILPHKMDPFVIFDALFNALACEEKDLRRPVIYSLSVIMNTCIHLLHSKEKTFAMPMMDYITDKMCSLCYERAWYAKMGGCEAISFFLDNASLRWVLVNHLHILKALLFVFIDLTGEVSAGSIDVAKENLTKLITLACSPVTDENLLAMKVKCLDTLALEFAKRLTSPTNHVREQCMRGLELLAELQGKTVSAVVEPHREVLVDMIPPRKHLIRHQSVQYQLGILDGNAFCLSLRPKLFSLDWSINEHKVFIQELLLLGEADENNLTKLPCYKLAPSVVPPRKAVMSVLACLAEVPTQRNKIIGIFLRHLNSPNNEVQKHAYECLKKFTDSDPISMEVQSAAIRPVLQQMTTFRSVTIPMLSQLSYLYQLFPHAIPEKVWETLVQILRKFLELAVMSFNKQPHRSGLHELKLCVAIVDCFHLLQNNASRFIEPLCKLCLQGEKALSLSKGSPLRKPLMKFLLKHPEEYLNCILAPPHITQPEWTRFFIYLIQQKEATSLRTCLMNNPSRLITWLNIRKHPTVSILSQGITTNYALKQEEQEDVQFLAVKTMMVLSTFDEDWILGVGPNRGEVVNALRQLWITPSYQHRCSTKYVSSDKPEGDDEVAPITAEGVVFDQPTTEKLISRLRIQQWKEPFMIVKLLLSYYRKNNTDYEMLFQLLYAFCGRPLHHFHFFRDYLDKTVTRLSIPWKRQAFFEFRKIYKDATVKEEVKAKIIQFVLIPCFAYCFDRNQGDELIGCPPSPDNDNPENIVNVLINEIIPQNADEKISDPERIALSQLCCLFLDQAPFHIHDNMSKKQGEKLKKLVTFAWPTLLSKSCVDSCVKYYGHLLLSHIAARFNINKRIVLQVFHSLLKASVQEAKTVVRQALDIITPALPTKMDDGHTMLIHWTKKLLLEEGYSMSQLTHLLQLIVRHWKVYYNVRHGLISHMIHAVNRLSFTPSSSMDHRKLAVDIAEVIVKWELERMKNEGSNEEAAAAQQSSSGGIAHDAKRMRRMSGSVVKLPQLMEEIQSSVNKPLDGSHVDSVLNFLMKMACHVNEPTPTIGSPGELLSKRCVALIKLVLKPDVWQDHLNNMKLLWMDKILTSFDQTQVNYPNICTALDLSTFTIGLMNKEIVLENMKVLQKGIISCMTCQNSKVIRAVHNLMSQLMSLFPSEFPGGNTTTSNVPKYDELDPLYTCVSKVVYEGLNTYEKMSTASPQSLLGALMMLKAACQNNPSYIDRIIATFMKCLQKLAREHLSPNTSSADAAIATDLLTSSLDLVKNRVGVMGVEMRKGFIGTVLVSLIEKSTDSKVMQTIIKMLEEWMKNKNPVVVNQGPSIREKSILLVKMMQNVEKRFPTDQELIGMFLDLINFIYRDDQLKATELNSKLEPAFLSGLRCSQPAIREKFFQVFDVSIKRRLYERLLYILCSQNWEAMGAHYWIKQCEELLLSTALSTDLEISPKEAQIPSVAQGFVNLTQEAKDTFLKVDPDVTCEPKDHEIPFIQPLERDIDNLMNVDETDEMALNEAVTKLEEAYMKEGWAEPSHAYANVKIMLNKEKEFGVYLKTLSATTLVKPLIQLCHLDTHLSEVVWISFFPRAWQILSEKQQHALANEMIPFLMSGVHVLQQHCNPSALNTFIEAMCQFVPAISLRPSLVFYLGKNHNLWHRMSLLLEQLSFETHPAPFIKTKKEVVAGTPTTGDCYEFEPTATVSSATASNALSPLPDVLDALSDLYCTLREDDLWAGLWTKRARYPETAIGISFEQQGYYEKAQGAYELAMSKARVDFSTVSPCNNQISEMKLWEEHWLKCAKELNQWDIIQEFSASKAGSNSYMVLEAAWRNGSWAIAKEALSNVELACPREHQWKLHMIRGYVAVCSSEDQNLGIVERYVDGAQTLCIKEWKRLPHLVSNVHIGVLQATQQVVELQEATLIHQSLLANRVNALHELKGVVKTWRNRLPCISDDLSHWSDIFSWRTHHYQFIASHFSEQSTVHTEQGSNQTMLGVHASAQAICHFGKVARKHSLVGVALETLSKIYAIPSVPIVDCFQKIKQQVKCYIQQAQILGRNELQEALEIVESTNLKYFAKEMTAEFFSLKGLLLSQIGRSDEANKAFSASCQLHDTLAKSWGHWGDYLEHCFTRDLGRQMHLGISAVTAFMHACRHQNETKSRKYVAKILWLLMYDDDKGTLSDAVDKYCVGVPPIQWLPWVPQLLSSLVRNDGKMVINVLNQVGRVYPQAVYFPIRTLYLTLKVEQREKLRNAEFQSQQQQQQLQQSQPQGLAGLLGQPPNSGGTPMQQDSSGTGGDGTNSNVSGDNSQSGTGQQSGIQQPNPNSASAPEAQAIKATPSMWRCSRIMHMQRDCHPTVLSSLEGIVDQLIYFRENWHEELLKQLKIGLARCYGIAFENRNSVLDATLTQQVLNFVRKLILTFGINANQVAPASTDANLRRQQMSDPGFMSLKAQFTNDFDYTISGSLKLHNLISKLRKWIKILEGKTKTLSRTLLYEDRSKFLLSFNMQIAEIELPGEFLIPKHAHYYVKIARFQPKIDVIVKHQFTARRMYIRGHNGKVYPYLVVNDSVVLDARREERVLQLIRMLNHYLGRQKVTARRNMRFTVPKLVAVSPQIRLIEDNPASLSLLEVFKLYCGKSQSEYDSAVLRYYDKLATIQMKGGQFTHHVLRDIFRDIQTNVVHRGILKEWAWNNFVTPSDYWMFRKIFTTQICLSGFAEYAFHLTRLNPEMMNIHQDSGMVNISYFKFDIDDTTGDLDSNRPVPFRLTPNISEFLTSHGVNGPIVCGMISLARCLVYPNYKLQAILRAVLRDEMISYIKKKQDDRGVLCTPSGQSTSHESESDTVINMVNKAVNGIMARLTSLSAFDGPESKVSTLVAAANSPDNLCRMDPTWLPWL
ncbi:unnamed protein product [Orchesella dallaii]|uniref:Transformation/transcription domain-associated protein n=1 Tax=Orchesella dallaii TaxID=48710 RepID=A0ABP1RKH1_9HEXA